MTHRVHGPQLAYRDGKLGDRANGDHFVTRSPVVLPPGCKLGRHPEVGADLVVAAPPRVAGPAAAWPPAVNRQRAAFGPARRGILGQCQNEESPAQIAELPGRSRTATGRKPSALRSMPGRRRTSWPRMTGKRSQAGALIRTRPTIATERGTGPAQDQNPAASSTALRANAATGISRRTLPSRMGPVAGERRGQAKPPERRR